MVRTKITPKRPSKTPKESTSRKRHEKTSSRGAVNSVPRRTSYEFVALTMCKRTDNVHDTTKRKDPDFKARISQNVEGDARVTRYSKRTYSKMINDLPILNPEHSPADEEHQFNKFKQAVQTTSSCTKSGSTEFYETDHGIWCATMVRYENCASKEEAISAIGNTDFWKLYNASGLMLATDIYPLLQKKKPICVVVGSKMEHKSTGHAATLVILPTATVTKAYVKDCLPIKGTTVNCIIYPMLAELKIETVDLVGELDIEEHVLATECLKESYKVIGEVLDGMYFWDRVLTNFKRTFDVKGGQEIYKKA